MTFEPGQIIDGKYRILRLVGSGGMGSVYEGENARIHRRVAIKVLHASVAAKADVVQRFEREAQAAGRIGSEHIVEVLDLGQLPDGERYMVMEFLEGEDLGERIKRRRRLDPREVAPILVQLLQGLAAAHEAGIIHRDLKPDNVFLVQARGAQRDFVKILDFGVSKFSVLDAASMSMTSTGAVMGTPYYMSPEQARGAKVDPRSDLYSVGVIMYQAVTGRVPFDAETFNELVFKIALESPHPAELFTPGIDPAFAALLNRAMMRDAAARFQSSQEFQAALQQWITGSAGVPTMTGGFGPPGLVVGGGTAAMPSPITPEMLQNAYGQPPQAPQLGQSSPGAPPPFTPPGGMMSPSRPSFSAGVALGGPGAPMPGFGASHAGLAITGPQAGGNGKIIAAGVAAALLCGALAAGGYFFVRARATAQAGLVSDAPSATPPSASEAAPTPPASEAPAASAPPPASAAADPAPAPSTSAAEKTPPTKGTPVKAPPTKPTSTSAAPKPTGRVIGGEL